MFAGPGEELVQSLGRSVSREVLFVRAGVVPFFITVLLHFDLCVGSETLPNRAITPWEGLR
jgi:hypothetical protein